MENDSRLRALLLRHRPVPKTPAAADLAERIWRRAEPTRRPQLVSRVAWSAVAFAAVVLVFGSVMRQRASQVEQTAVAIEAARGIQSSLRYMPTEEEQEEAFSGYLVLADATE